MSHPAPRRLTPLAHLTRLMLSAAVALVAMGGTGFAAQAPGANEADVSATATGITLDLRDAPIGQAILLLSKVWDKQWCLDGTSAPEKPVLVTIKLRESLFEEALNAITQSVDPPLLWTRTMNVYIIRFDPLARQTTSEPARPRETPNATNSPKSNALPSRNLREALLVFPRRVAGISYKGDTGLAAILLNGEENALDNPDDEPFPVKPGASVASGVQGIPKLFVESISPKQVVLRVPRDENTIRSHVDGFRIFVPLRGASVETSQPRR